MNCLQCKTVSKRQIDCNGCKSKFCSLSCMMKHCFTVHYSLSSISTTTPTPSSLITTPNQPKTVTSLKMRSRINHPSSSLKLHLGIMLNIDIKPLSYEEFSKFQIKQFLIGSGSYSNVYLSINSIDQKEYAIKWMNKKSIKEKIGSFEPVNKEIEIHLKLNHPNIVRLYFYYEDSTSFYLLMEYCHQGNLFQTLKRKKCFEETEALNYFIQVALAVYFLHENDLIHRDIKPENLLLDNNNILKLCDFGLCNSNSIGNRNTVCGTLEYMAPEILNENSYDKSVDIWSLGVLLFELTNGQTPYKQNLSNQTHHIHYVNQNISVPCKELINKMLCHDPKQRITVKNIFNEAIISNMVVKTIKKININGTYTINRPFSNDNNLLSSIVIQKKEKDVSYQESIGNYTIAQTEPNNLYRKKNARSNSSFDENLFKFHQPSKIGLIAKDMITLNKYINNDNDNDTKSTYNETTLRKNERYLSSKENKGVLANCLKVNCVISQYDNSNESYLKNQICVNNHLLDAINLVERAKAVKSQIEISFNK